MWPTLFVIALAAVIWLSNRAVESPGGGSLVHDNDEYQQRLAKANEIFGEFVPPLDEGQPVTPAIEARLREDAKLYEELNVFDPTKSGPYFASGRLHLLLNEPDIAIERFKQAIDNGSKDQNASNFESEKLQIAQSHMYLGACFESKQDWQNALVETNTSLQLLAALTGPSSAASLPEAHFTRARALIQMKEYDAAKSDLEEALKLNPSYSQAASLKSFLEKAPTKGS
jgi:tetratricopeptide (TPR) repeat protein